MNKHEQRGAWVALMFVTLTVACAELEKEKVPTVITTGSHQVLQGQTVQVAATTQNATDTGYTFASGANAVATVSATGLVAGVSPGEAIITVTGVPSGGFNRSSQHVVWEVIIAAR